jgi:hypothetical protein
LTAGLPYQFIRRGNADSTKKQKDEQGHTCIAFLEAGRLDSLE